MSLELSREDFTRALKIVSASVSTKLSTPILSTVLLESKGSKLMLKGTDLEMGIETELDVKTGGSISICIPLHRILGFLEYASEDKIKIEKKGENYVIIAGKPRFEFNVFDGSEFPSIPSEESGVKVVLSSEEVKQLVNYTSFAASKEETRYELTGIHFAIQDTAIELAATDGRRLAHITHALSKNPGSTITALVPARVCDEVCEILDLLNKEELEVIISSKLVVFKAGTTKITAKTLEGNFPNYKQVIPKSTDISATVNAQELKRQLERLSSMGFKSEPVRFTFSSGKLLTACKGVGGYVEDEVESDYKGKKIEIGFSPQYIIDVLKRLKAESVRFGIKDPTSPVLIESPDVKGFVYVVMPVRLD